MPLMLIFAFFNVPMLVQRVISHCNLAIATCFAIRQYFLDSYVFFFVILVDLLCKVHEKFLYKDQKYVNISDLLPSD